METASTSAQNTSLIVHICPRQDWEQAQRAGQYRAASLDTEGFIHASRPEQVLGVANRFYRGINDLVLLWIEPGWLQAPLQFDPVDGDTYPHLYGPVNLEAVVRVTPFQAGADGEFNHLV
jgi:uncharacterized protein (DUF952 family)